MTGLVADMSLAAVLGQICGLIALGFCIAGFANKNDDRLMVLVTNVITIIRLYRLRKKYRDVIEPLLDGEADHRS